EKGAAAHAIDARPGDAHGRELRRRNLGDGDVWLRSVAAIDHVRLGRTIFEGVRDVFASLEGRDADVRADGGDHPFRGARAPPDPGETRFDDAGDETSPPRVNGRRGAAS